MNVAFRCDCPFTSAIDLIGDRWTLVIVKQMLLEDKKTFKDFVRSNEAIASNILSDRLKMLEAFQLIKKEKFPNNKKINIYRLTEKGLGLTPVLVELGLWSNAHLREFNPEIMISDQLTHEAKEDFIKTIIANYQAKVNADTLAVAK
ncbi:MAG: helix-turn-helix domain-containing protein [Bacteroidota bacterium]